MDDFKVRFYSAMVLSGVGDAMGYKNGRWEFGSFPQIIKDYNALGGYKNININRQEWRVSDDTVMHMATAIAITRHKVDEKVSNEKLCEEMALAYVRSMEDMNGRAPGRQSIESTSYMTPGAKKKCLKWNEIPYGTQGGGCGGAMRSMCIGLKYSSPDQLETLIELSIESGRITHNHPVGFLGAMVSALFTSYALQEIATKDWGSLLFDKIQPLAREYLKKTENQSNRKWEDYERGWNYFWTAWESYLKLRKIPFSKYTPPGDIHYPIFPDLYDFKERDEFYASISFSGWGGSSGHDSVIIAYDALLGAGDSWEEMIKRAILHSGDNDSTGAIGCCWWGAIYGFYQVPACNYDHLEYRSVIEGLAAKLYELRW